MPPTTVPIDHVAAVAVGQPTVGPDPSGQVRLWTPVELAGFLGVPVKTVYRWRGQGTGPTAFRVGRHLRYHPTEVHRWLATLADDPHEPGGTGG
jgi:excisionase family DNA binding protein